MYRLSIEINAAFNPASSATTALTHSITESTVRRLTIGQRIEKRDASTAQLSPAHFARAILKVSYTGYSLTALMLNISITVTDTTMVSMEVEYETIPGLSIGTMTYDLG